MKAPRWILAVGLVLVCATQLIGQPIMQPGQLGQPGQPGQLAQPGATTAGEADRMQPYVNAVLQAEDPSAAVSAFATGYAADKAYLPLQDAYVKRMVEFGMPELAYRQATGLTGLEPENGLNWAVIAYVDAKRGKLYDAIAAIGLAVNRSATDPFVQSVGGELVAWADSGPQPPLPDLIKRTVEKVRQNLDGRAAYVESYKRAKAAFEAEARAQPPALGAAQPQASDLAQIGQLPPPAATADYGAAGYAVGYPVADQFYYAPGIVYPAYYATAFPFWWQPCGSFDGLAFVRSRQFLVLNLARHHAFGHHGLAGIGLAAGRATNISAGSFVISGHNTGIGTVQTGSSGLARTLPSFGTVRTLSAGGGAQFHFAPGGGNQHFASPAGGAGFAVHSAPAGGAVHGNMRAGTFGHR
jgi:hypothetical protein